MKESDREEGQMNFILLKIGQDREGEGRRKDEI